MKFKVYDKVWVMSDNKPKEMIVYSVIETMAFNPNATSFKYTLVHSIIGAGAGNNKDRYYTGLFKTKEDLLASL